MKLDLCVAINGINLDCLVPMFFETLFSKVNVSCLNIHVVEKGTGENIHRYLEEKQKSSSALFHIYRVDEPFVEETGPERKPVVWSGGDAALTCKWMMENCGNQNWAVISHFDLAFEDDFTVPLLQKITPDTGMVGAHNQGLVAINRIAYRQCFVGFQSMSGFFVVKDSHLDNKVRYGEDPRCTDRKSRIEGFDVAELLELNMQFRGWRVTQFPEFMHDHIAAGSGYHGNEGIAKSQRSRAMEVLSRNAINPIGA